MFQIKTDIRQYNCETREKVEKLIRNWVIRPSDLIYNEKAGEWNPIGQHPSFDELFRELDDEESRVPDTVVTSDRPRGEDEEGGEVTQITESPLEDEGDEEAEETGDAEDEPVLPEPSEDVEGVIRDSDEITMMTDKTLDMMRTDGEEEPDEAVDEEESTDVVERDEVAEEKEEDTDVVERDEVAEEKEEDTDVVERDEVAEEKEEDTDVVERDGVDGSPDEPTHIIERDEVEGEGAEEESTNVVEHDDLQPDSDEEEPSIVVDPEVEEEAQTESNGGGRHGLPEDVFVTNEIPSQAAQEGVLDELGELEEDDEDFDLDEGLSEASDEAETDEEPESEERGAKWRIVMSEDEDDVDAEWENVAEEIRDTDELSQDEVESTVSEAGSQPQEDLDFEEEQDEERGEDVEAAQSAEVGEEEQDESELEEVEVEAVDAQFDEDDDLDGLLDDAAELVGVSRKDAASTEGEAAEREPLDTPVGEVTDPAFVSEGYKMELPIDVGPSEQDLAIGVPKANVSEAVKESTFPYPKPKYPGQVIIRKFGLGEDLADDDGLAEDLPAAGDSDVDPHAETKPVEGGPEAKSRSRKTASSRSRKSASEKPKDQSALIVIFLLGTFIIALILAVYFLG